MQSHHSSHIYEINNGVDNVPISKTIVEQYLDVKVDNKLTFSNHIQESVNKENGILAII